MRRAMVTLLVALALPTASAAAELACPGSLAGSWYLLIHYHDTRSQHRQRVHWRDRVWTIAVTEKKVTWTDYPYVVFDHSEGRFAGGPARGRRLPDWVPDSAQVAEIRRGLVVNVRPARTESLLPGPSGVWSSADSQGATPGFVSYVEHWSISRRGPACVLAQTESFGAGAGRDEGGTEYRITGSEKDGSLHGSYERDGHLQGTVRLLPSGPVRPKESVGPPGVRRGRSTWPRQR